MNYECGRCHGKDRKCYTEQYIHAWVFKVNIYTSHMAYSNGCPSPDLSKMPKVWSLQAKRINRSFRGCLLSRFIEACIVFEWRPYFNFRYSFSEAIPIFSNRFKRDFILLRSLWNFYQWLTMFVCQNAVLSKIDITINDNNKQKNLEIDKSRILHDLDLLRLKCGVYQITSTRTKKCVCLISNRLKTDFILVRST